MNLTAWEHIGLGFFAVPMAAAILAVQVFILLFLGRLWRRMNRTRRQMWMSAGIILAAIITAGIVIGVPSSAGRFEESSSGDSQDPHYVMGWRFGIAAWVWNGERLKWGTGISTPVAGFSVIGLAALLRSLVVTNIAARSLIRWLPRMYRRPEPLCDECGYDLRHSRSPVCPECGSTMQ